MCPRAGGKSVGKLAGDNRAMKANQPGFLHQGVEQQRHITITEKNLRVPCQRGEIKERQQAPRTIAGPRAENCPYRRILEHQGYFARTITISASKKAVAI